LCPGIVPRVKSSLGQRWVIAATRLISPRRMFGVPLDDPELFTVTPRWQRFIEEDPLSLRQITARLSIESVRLDYYLRLFRPRFRFPLLLLLAGQDRIVQNEPTRRYLERCAAGDKQIIEYPQAHHTLEFEPDPDLFIKDLLHWLQTKVRPRRGSSIAVEA
jgi:alpha-beta hydrolase superfamily lysophospholipase